MCIRDRNDVSLDPRYLPTPGVTGTHAELAVPILLGSDVLGVVNVERGTPFDQDDAEALRIVADQLAVAIENARLYEAEGERRATMMLDLARTALAEMRGLLAELRPHGMSGERPSMPPLTDPGLTTVSRSGLVAALRAHFVPAILGDLRVRLDADAYVAQPPEREA